MHRRSLLAAALAFAPSLLLAQRGTAVPRVAVFMYGPPANIRQRVNAFLAAMKSLGYEDGRNVRIEVHSANGQPELVAQIATTLAGSRVDVVLSGSTITTKALHDKTRTLPIVMAAAEDPVAEGFVKSLARPGANITGVSATVLDLIPRHVDYLAAVVPRLAHVAALVNPVNATYPEYASRLQRSMRAGMTLTLLEARGGDGVDEAFLPGARGNA